MRRLLLALSMLAAGLGACGTAARAQGLLPATGLDTRVGDLRGYFQQAFGAIPAPEAATHVWTFSGAVDVSETYDTGVAIPSGSGVGHDLITRIAPSLGVTGDSARLVGSLFYTPTINLYAFHGNQNGIDHNLNAAATATVIPDWFFVDLRGYAAEQSITGFYGPTGTTVLSRSDEVQTTSFSIAPTLRHRFGGTAVMEAGYSVTRTAFNTGYTNTAALQQLNQTSITEEEHASVGTGDDFGRLSDSLSAAVSQSSGSGALTSTHSQVFADNIAYAVSRSVAVTGSIGHEDISYGGATPYRINDLTWSGGLHLTPSPDTDISLGYQHQQGASSFYLNGTYAATARTRIYATYSQGVGTYAQNLQNAVAATTVGPTGVTTSTSTGAPVVLTNNFFGTRLGLFRTRQATISGATLWPRDLFTASLQNSQYTQLATGIAGSTVNNSTSGTSGSVSWAHDLSDDLHSNALAQYGVNSGSGVGGKSQSSVLLNASLSYSISTTLSASAQFTYTTEPTGISGRSMAREIAVVSLHKSFF